MTLTCQEALRDAESPALLLSGGLDSGSILAGCVEAGLTPDLYTIRFGEEMSEDEDLAHQRAEHIAPHLDLRTITVPANADLSVKSMKNAIVDSGAVLKTTIEVMVIMYPVLEKLRNEGHDVILHGMTGGIWWGLAKELSMTLHRDGEPAWKNRRLAWVQYDADGYPVTAARLSNFVAKDRYGMEMRDPLAMMGDFFDDCSFAELNKPKPKNLALEAFPALQATGSLSSGMQVEAGVREHMAEIARLRGYSSAVAMYNDVARKLGIAPRGDDKWREVWNRRSTLNLSSISSR